MTIGIDIRSLLAGPATGVGKYVLGLLTGLSDLFAEGKLRDNYILCGTGVRTSSLKGDDRLRSLPFELRQRTIPNKILTGSWLSMQYPSMQQLFPGVDAWLLPNIAMYPYRQTNPYSLIVHDLSFMHYPYWYSIKRRLWHRAIRVKHLLMNAHSLIAVSQSTARDIISFFPELDEKRSTVIPPAIESAGSFSASTTLGLQLPKEYILFIGTLEPRKNVQSIIEAFQILSKKYPGIDLVLAGTFGWSVHQVPRLIASNSRIHWLRYITDEEKLLVYRGARLFIWPSFYEGFGFPPLEALREEVPVVTSYRTSLPEVLGEHAIFVNPYNVGELTTVIDQLLQAAAIPGHLRQIPIAYAERTWKQVATEYVSFLTRGI